MNCVEYFYSEAEAQEFVDMLNAENYEGITSNRTLDYDEEVPCYVWVITWDPKEV